MLKKTFYRLSALLPLSAARQLNGNNPLLPYHHVVSNHYLQHIAEIYPYKNEQAFKADVDVLIRYGNKVPLQKTLAECINTGSTTKGSVILSFDDGFKEIYTTIAPILKTVGLNAIFFINPDFIDNKKLFYRNKISILISLLRQAQDTQLRQLAQVFKCQSSFDALRQMLLNIHTETSQALAAASEILQFDVANYLQEHQPYLTTAQIQELSKQGFLFGGHSMSHPYYHQISLEEQLQQTAESVKWIHQHIQQEYKLFSFPHTDALVHQSFFDKLKGLEFCPDILFGTQNMRQEVGNPMLHRFNAERPQFNFSQLLKAMSLYKLAEKSIGRDQVKRQP